MWLIFVLERTVYLLKFSGTISSSNKNTFAIVEYTANVSLKLVPWGILLSIYVQKWVQFSRAPAVNLTSSKAACAVDSFMSSRDSTTILNVTIVGLPDVDVRTVHMNI